MRNFLRSAKAARFVRFLVVGVGAAILLFVLTYLFRASGMPPFAGSMAAYLIAFATAYTAQRGWTFGGEHSHRQALPRYLAVQAGCALTAGAVAHGAVSGLGWSPLAMSLAVTIAASAASYVLSTRWVFASSRISKNDPQAGS